MKKITHIVSGNNFHGDYSVSLRGAPDGFILSKAQARKYTKALCGMSDCICGGGYGDGPDEGSARVYQTGYDELYLDTSGELSEYISYPRL